jgi:hypothetical protein
MAFLLNVEPLASGTTRIEFDVSPTERVQVVAFSEHANLVVEEDATALLDLTLAATREPLRTRRRFSGSRRDATR